MNNCKANFILNPDGIKSVRLSVISLAWSFDLLDETLSRGAEIFEKYSILNDNSMGDTHTSAISSLLIAAKYEETSGNVPSFGDVSSIVGLANPHSHMSKIESRILNDLGYDVSFKTMFDHVESIIHRGKHFMYKNRKQYELLRNFMRFMTDIISLESCIDIDSGRIVFSMIHVFSLLMDAKWSSELFKMSHYNFDDLKSNITSLFNIIIRTLSIVKSGKYKILKVKFSSKKFGNILRKIQYLFNHVNWNRREKGVRKDDIGIYIKEGIFIPRASNRQAPQGCMQINIQSDP